MEIIIVVAMISAILGVAGYGLSLVSGKPAEQCARKLSSALSHARTSTMGKYRNVVTITSDSDGVKFDEHIVISLNDEDGTEDKTNDRDSIVGASSVKVEYCLWTEGNASFNDLSQVRIRFDSGSGKLKQFGVGESNMSNITDTSLLIFRISKANTVRYVTVTALTGTVEVTSESPKPESGS